METHVIPALNSDHRTIFYNYYYNYHHHHYYYYHLVLVGDIYSDALSIAPKLDYKFIIIY